MTGTISQWSPCNMKSLSACITGVPAVSAYTKLPVLSQSKRKKQKNNRDPITSRQVAQFPVTQSCSSTLTAQEPHNTFQRVAKVIRCWQMSFVMTVTATIKLTISIITIFAPKVPIHKEHVFFCKYKEIHRMILYTTYNKYCVSYILLFEWMYWV